MNNNWPNGATVACDRATAATIKPVGTIAAAPSTEPTIAIAMPFIVLGK